MWHVESRPRGVVQPMLGRASRGGCPADREARRGDLLAAPRHGAALSHPQASRRRRDGDGLSRRADAARARRDREGLACAAAARPRDARAVPPRGRGSGEARAPVHLPRARFRRAGRDGVHRHALSQRRLAGRPGAARARGRAAGGGLGGGTGRGGARPRAPARCGAPRREARQHPVRRRRQRADHRLRDRHGAVPRPTDRERPRDGDAALHEPRAGDGEARRRPQRSLRARRGDVRGARRLPAVRRRRRVLRGLQARAREAGADRRDRLARARAAGGGRHALPGEVGVRPIRARHRARRCAHGVPGRLRRGVGSAPRRVAVAQPHALAARMKLSHEIIALHTKHPFIIARGGSSEYRVVRVTVTDDDGRTGWGEAAPSKHYGETADTVASVLPVLAPLLQDADGWSLEALERAMAKAIRFNASARAAVSAALHDLAGKRLGVPLHRMWGLDSAGSPPTSFTIAIAPDEATLRDRVREATGYPVLKIKLGTSWDERIVRIIREMEPGKVLRVDANAAWTPKYALAMIPILAELGVEFVEQPLPAHDVEGLRFVRERSSLPIIADE